MHNTSGRRGEEALFDGSPMPRYAQLADVFRRRIARSDWPPGARLPTLEALMREFDVARVTVRQAMELLAREGLVSPQRGRGTFVTAEPQRNKRLQLETSLQALADVYGDDTPNLTLIEEASAAPRLSPGDGTPAPRYHFMRRVHSRHGEPYCVISIYLDERISYDEAMVASDSSTNLAWLINQSSPSSRIEGAEDGERKGNTRPTADFPSMTINPELLER